MGKSVYLSPSTQEKNIGVLTYGTEEARCNSVADVVETELKRHGVTVYRNKPSMTLSEVVADSNSKKATIHQAIHTNAYNKTSRGNETFCFKMNNSLGHILAKNVYSEVSAITPTVDRGVKEGYNFYGEGKHMYEVYATSQPACLTEIIFHDNEDDVKWFLSNIKNIGIAITKGILKTLSITYIPETTSTTNTTTETIETLLKEIVTLKTSVKALEAKLTVNSTLIGKIQELVENIEKPESYDKVLKLIKWVESYE